MSQTVYRSSGPAAKARNVRVLMLDVGLPSEARFADALAEAAATRSIELDRVSNRFQLESLVEHEDVDGVLLVDVASDAAATDVADVSAWLRACKPSIALVVLVVAGAPTARCAVWIDEDIDDCMLQPIDVAEAAARLAAALRRKGRALPQRELRHGDLVLDRLESTVTWRDEVFTLTPREAVILRVLIERAGHVVSREILHHALHGDADVRGNTVEVYVHGLRRKLHPGLIRTVRGAGYRLTDVAPLPARPATWSRR